VKRRAFMAAAALLPLSVRAAVDYAQVVPHALSFPRDHGSHPSFRTEWWYITGWAEDARGVARGVQVTFFRTRPGVAEASKSALAPTQVLFAHAALADPSLQRLRHDQRAARAVLGLARAAEETTDVVLDDWSLRLTGDTYRTRIPARDFTLDLAFVATGAPLLQGEAGVSRKGPQPAQASHYYSRPQLALQGTITAGRVATTVSGRAWLDHEWSSEYLAPGARGWDWIGVNLDDGGALMAFRIRGDDDRIVWAGGTLRGADGRVSTFAPDDIRFAPQRTWTSPRTGLVFPVAMRVSAGDLVIDLEPLFDDQELDARASVGTVYWEGAVQAAAGGRRIGRGYLELTGYGAPLRI
jgi:predicted secreted hydrolase